LLFSKAMQRYNIKMEIQ